MDFEEYKAARIHDDYRAEYNFHNPRRRDLARAYYHYLLYAGLSKLWMQTLKMMYKQHKFFETEHLVTEFQESLNVDLPTPEPERPSDIVVATRVEAENTLAALRSLIDKNGLATVSELYEIVGISASYSNEKRGWTDLSGQIDLRRAPEGWYIQLPDPKDL